jgi:hypothetical protein
LSEADVEEIKGRLAQAYSNKQDTQTELVEDLKADLAKKSAEIQKFKEVNDDLQRRVKTGAVANGAAGGMANGKTVQQQIAEFDVMKKSLMRDLQNRCERVVELEISLDETREQYNNVLRSSNNRAQQKKMAFLERNLEQLTHVQRQLVEQNGSLKKEVAIAERKLIARNERIQSLETLLQDSQEKLTAANHRYVLFTPTVYLPSLTQTTDSKLNSQQSKSASNPPKQEAPGALARRLAKVASASVVQALASPSHCVVVVVEKLPSPPFPACSRVRARELLVISEARGFSRGRSRLLHCKRMLVEKN